jgi:hypothetical protein
MNAFARSWALFKSTLAVLNADKALLWFPVLATTATLAVSAVIFGGAAAILVANPAAQAYLSQAAAAAEAGNATLLQMLFFFASLFFYYLVINFTANYFMTGLAGAALLRFAGQDPGFGDGIRIANSRLGAIFGYSVIAATVGVLLSALRGRSGDSGSALAGRLVASIGEFAWGVATFLVVPVIAAKGPQPLRGHQGECVAAAPHLGRAVDRRIGDRPDLLCDYAAAGVSGRVDHHRLWRIQRSRDHDDRRGGGAAGAAGRGQQHAKRHLPRCALSLCRRPCRGAGLQRHPHRKCIQTARGADLIRKVQGAAPFIRR